MNFPLHEPIRLENSRSLLRPLGLADAEGLQAAAFSEENINQYTSGPLNTPALLEAYVRLALEEKEKGIRYPFLIVDKATGAYAGSTSFAFMSDADQRLEIGFTWLGKPFKRTGLNRSNKLLMLEYAFDHLGYERVEFRADERNTASCKAMEAIGARYEGTLRRYKVAYDGFRRSVVFYSILREEWWEMPRL